MMRLLVFVLCVQSLSQLLPSAHAKPDFGIKLPIKSSGKVSTAAQNAQTVLLAADDNTPYMVEANYKGLQELANITVRVATDLVTIGSDLVPNVTALVSDVSGNMSDAFATMFTSINTTKEAISTKLPIAIADIKAVFKTHFASEGLDYIPKQFSDGFRRIVLGLNDLTAKLQTLRLALDTAGTQAGGVTELTEALVKQYVKPAFIYEVVFSINQLKAYLPVIKYTIDSTLENINLADDYLLLVQKASNQSADVSGTVLASVKNVTDALAIDVKAGVDSYALEYSGVAADIQNLTHITAAPAFSNVTGALSSFREVFNKTQTKRYTAMDDQLQTLLNTIANALSAGNATTNVSSPLLDSLILTVIENGKYAQFCFNKYMGLVFGFLTSLSDNSALCVDKEITRLEYLQDTLATVRILLPPDYEDLFNELSICNSLTTPDNLNECVQALSGFYTEVVANFDLKMQYLFELIETEAAASANRFLICNELAKVNLVEFTETDLINSIRACALTGPTADD
ncbi:AGAP007272-PA [Anopheles gambiae str. PEST]|uniref:AGAP007272-PA n=1 Tax=Anopheles gambiae TaxID=7165 RepID=A7URI2_ANOGA|nr:AGAP007272-PA [Anopheles gambiae str. PEST]